MSSNMLKVVSSLSQHHTGNMGHFDSPMTVMGQLYPPPDLTPWSQESLRVVGKRSTGERRRQECRGG